MKLTKESLAKMIDHTVLAAHATKGKVSQLCDEARDFGFFSVCVNPCWTSFAAEKLQGSDVEVCVVAGFPLGANKSEIKALEAKTAVAEGAGEVDMVMNVGALRAKDYDYVSDDIKRVVDATGDALLKVILETCYLTNDEIVKACELCVEAGADFVKTSTGMGGFGAFPDHIKLMRSVVGPDIGVKASGGISNFKDVWRLVNAGASRIGASAGIGILEGLSLYNLAPDAWLEPEIPCHFCPQRHASMGKMPKALYIYHTRKCSQCEHRAVFNKFYE
jgi:deoxyribose-phosphate aldolase